MSSETIVDAAIEYAKDLFKDNSDGHGIDHAIRVYRNSQILMKSYPEADNLVVSIAALLHDVDDHKLFDTHNNANARVFLNQMVLSEEKIDCICNTINSVSFSQNYGKVPKTIEGKIVQDADRLDAIGAIGIARTFAYGGKMGRSLGESIQHFYDKLLLLKDGLNTDRAKELAQNRHDYMIGFLEEYYAETDTNKDIEKIAEDFRAISLARLNPDKL